MSGLSFREVGESGFGLGVPPEPRIGCDEVGEGEPEVGSALRREAAMLDGLLPLRKVAVKVANLKFPDMGGPGRVGSDCIAVSTPEKPSAAARETAANSR